jgi:tRNA-modifying protein YgfZ
MILVSMDPVRTEIAGQSVVLHYSDPGVEYAAFRAGAVAIDRTHRSRWRLRGPQAAEMLTGLVTNDVVSLPASGGGGQYAGMLTAKGKIVADLTIYRLSDSILIDVPPRAAAGFAEVIKKFLNPRVTRYSDETSITADVGAYGARAAPVVAAVTELDPAVLLALPAHGHIRLESLAPDAIVARVPTLGLDGFTIIAPTDARANLWRRLLIAGATPAGLATWDIARVEAGQPEWGIDIDESTIPQEANFDDLGAISYTKGCYTGQETVARIHFRGHVNRHLRGLFLTGEDLPPLHASLVDPNGKTVGDVRSTVRSPRLGPIALAIVRREVEIGTELTVRWDLGSEEAAPRETTATVADLPFHLG